MMIALACAAFVAWWKLKPATPPKDVVTETHADTILPQAEKEKDL